MTFTGEAAVSGPAKITVAGVKLGALHSSQKRPLKTTIKVFLRAAKMKTVINYSYPPHVERFIRQTDVGAKSKNAVKNTIIFDVTPYSLVEHQSKEMPD